VNFVNLEPGVVSVFKKKKKFTSRVIALASKKGNDKKKQKKLKSNHDNLEGKKLFSRVKKTM